MAETLKVAIGSRRYCLERPFGAWSPKDGPAGGTVTDVATSTTGIHVLVRYADSPSGDAHPVVTLDRATGTVIGRWGSDLIVDAHKIAAYGDRLFVVDRDAHQVIVTDEAGRALMRLGTRHAPSEPFNHPTDVAVGPDGTIFVSDGYAGTSIHRFSPEGAWETSWGGWGTEPGQFVNPHGIWATRDGRIAVADRENGRLQVFDHDGALLDVRGGFYRPADVWGDADDRLYVVDGIPSLTCLGREGRVLGRCRPVLNGAHGLWGDADGTLYLAEANPSRITRLVTDAG